LFVNYIEISFGSYGLVTVESRFIF